MRIVLEPNLTEKQLVKLYLNYKEEIEGTKLKEKHREAFLEAKRFVEMNKNEILRNSQQYKFSIMNS